ncbi:1-acyl-sn-glycerol-3-phosphate acyltransferase [Hyella patelloides LEGE 07179]|uniref:1-acyl-sn-glycerol-3-phosphate acyltransferase n=1 Tax=Hyella patelloides LEGE 07179 TaxID=945734 RepID=A0A563VW33_9CYAN|nr:1-acyl-sn-glycerol-3-phosphate acyltransferase [Hyella patelloides]VEP15626.1 1-acyl-sn-glycerol-3-phosphate acyltransferase [Hyella patelloides LEGE 07179]
MIEVQPPLKFIPPAFNPLVWHSSRSLLPLWLHYRQGITEVRVDNGTELIELYQQFQQGQTRFLLAFRHPSTVDPPCISQLLWNLLPQIAQRQGKPLNFPVHTHFIYDRGIPLWAGKQVGWLISQLGGTPIRRGSVDRQGLRSIRDLFVRGKFPLAAAPEGATNGHNEIISPLEPGIAQFGFWCWEDLQKAQITAEVAIAPLGIQYHFWQAPWKSLEQLLSQLEVDSGFRQRPAAIMGLVNGVTLTPEQEQIFYERLSQLAEYLLSLMEKFYSQFYQQTVAPENEALTSRLPALLNAALTVAEQAFGVQSKGHISDRCRRVEQAGWERIYRQDVSESDSLAPAVRGLANLIASEAQLRLWHMRLVENFTSVTGHYVAEQPTVERFADTLLLLWKMIACLKGQTNLNPPFLGQKWVQFTVKPPLLISHYWDDYQSNRRQAVSNLTQDLQTALEQAISRSRKSF